MKSTPVRSFLLIIIGVMLMQIIAGVFVMEQIPGFENRTEAGWCQPDPEGESEGTEDEDGEEKYVAGTSVCKMVSATCIFHFTLYSITDFGLNKELISPPPRTRPCSA